ncbi:MAG TPA: PAS domain-containing protein, partial [Candidatus Methanoperedens sp.]|nr:PAS domain-containing protein [Candidatus Methanoperedens sp.]
MSPGTHGRQRASDLRLIHELEVHQIELRMQNEELLASRTALEESRGRYFDLFHLSPVGYLILDPRGAILDANLSAAELLGQPLPSLRPGSLHHYVDSGSRDAFSAHLRAATASAARVRCEITLVRRDGQTFAALLESSGVPSQEGAPSQVLTVLADISERKRAEETSRSERLAALNIMEDAVAARGDAERLSNALLREIAVRRQTERELRRVMERAELLAAAAADLLQSPEPDLAVQGVCGKLMAFLECQVFLNFLADARLGKLRLNAYAGIPAEEARRIELLDYGAAICGCVARDRRRSITESIPAPADMRAAPVQSWGLTAYA